eukprot:TRINITY_DN21_c1_g1_i1.p1 TRINITY_DN21_c1_g1~~TRINITY_DN21_c1_g1_i1.p1  ORF type:complete len:140 (+),score=23.47 TRINITY_DN21_c1_g1_i1:51-422(+)
MAKVKAYELRTKKRSELTKQLDELKNELAQLRVAKVTGGAPSKLAKIRTVRRSIRTVLKVSNTIQKEHLRLFYKKKAFKPLDLRVKKTRAMRRRMTPRQLSLVSAKTQNKRSSFPQRRFALKA